MAAKKSSKKSKTAAKATKPSKPVAKTAKKAAAVKTATKAEKPVAKSVLQAIKNVLVPAAKPKKNEKAVAPTAPQREALKKENQEKPAKKAATHLTEKATQLKEVQAAAATEIVATEVGVQEPEINPTDAEKKSLFRKINQAGQNWDQVFKLAKGLRPKTYKMSDTFEAKTPINHKVLGWGFVLSSENNRIQVLFKEGVKTLITNYQAK